jgi:transposase
MDRQPSLKQVKARISYPTPVGERAVALRAPSLSPTGVTGEAPVCAAVPDPEVSEKKQRRRFTAEYKLRILQEAGQCAEPGQLGALLRREALYSSHLTTWRRQREEGTLQGLSPKKRGRKAKPADPSAERIAKLEKENLRLTLNLRKAEIIIEAQKKISEILGIDQNLDNSRENN